MNAISAIDTGLPEGFADRLALFADWTGAAPFPPERVLVLVDGERTFSDDFLAYAHGTGLSLDWVWLNDERSLVIGAFHAAKDACHA